MATAPFRVRALALGFFGRLIEAGEVFTIQSEQEFAAKWMEKVDAGTQETEPAKLKYGIKSNGGGRWIVVSNEDDSRASVTFKPDQGDAKALAQAEANRLNAGGELLLDAVPQQHDADGGGNLPDA